ncbi:MAG: N-acetyl-alpha-D-glucosaminyl L-malate synthase BshA [Candidatus Bathyarchaeia archaeon]
MENLRIGVSCYSSIGGSGILAARLGVELAKKGNEVHFISYDMPVGIREVKHENIFFHHVSVFEYPLFKYPPYTAALASKMIEITQRHNLDLIHVHYAMPHAISALLSKIVTGTPYIVTLHGSDVNIVGNNPAYRLINAYSIENADSVTSVSKYLVQDAREKLCIKNEITVIPNFVDARTYSPPKEAERSDRFSIIHISNFRPVKRAQDIIEAISLVVKVDDDVRLILVGDGPERGRAEEMVREKDLNKHIHFTGFRNDIPLLLKQSDAFVLISDSESVPLTLLEAMSTGLPVISTRIGGVPEIVVNNENGILVPPRNPKKIAESILRLKNDEKFRKRLGLEARKTILERYTCEKIVRKYEEIYQKTSFRDSRKT